MKNRFFRVFFLVRTHVNGKFKNGFYTIKPFTTKHGIQTHRMENIPYFEVQYLFDKGHIILDHIYGAIICTGKLNKNLFYYYNIYV